jgi:polysaccharide biosynthesis protein PslG
MAGQDAHKRFGLAPLVGVALVLAFLLSISLPSHASAVEPGVVSDLSWGISSADKQKTATAMVDAGVRWTRIGLGWRNLEPSKGSYSSYWLADEDAAVKAANDAGVKVIVDVLESPQWASGSTNKYAAPKDPQDLANFMTFIANRYKGKVAAYEIWNEENGARFWPSGPSAAAYTQMLKAAYPAIKAVDPSVQVVFGGLANADYHYVEAAYAAGAKGYFDVMGVHPYTCDSPTDYWYVNANEQWVGGDGGYTPKSGERMTMYSFLGYREVHRSMVAAGDNKPIWFTEFGWSTGTGSCSEDAQTQAKYLTQAYQLAAQDPYVQVALWYMFREISWDGSSDMDGHGLLHNDFTPKPAYYAFRDVATGTGAGSTPPPVGSTPPPSSTPTGSPPSGSTTTPGSTTTASPPATTTDGKKHKKKKKKRARKARRASERRG